MKTFLLDTSFLIDLEEETQTGETGPATRALIKMGAAPLYISPVTVAELLEGAEDAVVTERVLAEYHATTIGWQAAKRCALNQSRAAHRMGENDAWQAALAVSGGHSLIGHDKAFEKRPWLDYRDHRKL